MLDCKLITKLHAAEKHIAIAVALTHLSEASEFAWAKNSPLSLHVSEDEKKYLKLYQFVN